jgi:hypothetical protein
MVDEQVARELKWKKAASKILLHFVHSFGGEGTALAICCSILTCLDAFALAYQHPLSLPQ